MDKSIVSIVRTKRGPAYEEIKEAIDRSIDLIGGIKDLVQPGQLVLVKPNLAAAIAGQESAVVTSPKVCRAVADAVSEIGGRAVIADSAAVGVDTEKVIVCSGYQELREMGYNVVDLKHEKPLIMLPVKAGEVFKKIQTYPLVAEADVIISVPKLKTHDQTEITCSIKNLKGLESDAHKRKTHKIGIVPGIVDFMSILKPHLAIVDGIICQEGLGPMYGRPVEMDIIITSRDLVAADSVCGRIIGYEPSEVRLTVEAARRGLGNMEAKDIEVVGESIQAVYRRFLRAIEDNPVEIEGFAYLSGDDTCTGCRNTVSSALCDMRFANQLNYLRGVTIVTGDVEIPSQIPLDSIVTVGNCVPKVKRGKRFVQGCPPNNAWVVNLIVAGKTKVSRRYAENAFEETGEIQ